MITALATAPAHVAHVAHPYGYGWGPGPWVLLFPLFWLVVLVVVVSLVARRRRAGWCGPGWGQGWGQGGPGGDPYRALGERYARGEIDDEEYRRRLEVLRASDPSR